jgi:hypothetical protein
MFQTKVVEKIKTYILYLIFFLIVPFMRCVKKVSIAGQSTDDACTFYMIMIHWKPELVTAVLVLVTIVLVTTVLVTIVLVTILLVSTVLITIVLVTTVLVTIVLVTTPARRHIPEDSSRKFVPVITPNIIPCRQPIGRNLSRLLRY